MTRLPNTLQPAWPLVKRLHRLASRWMGYVVRPLSRLHGERALPQRATATVGQTADSESGVTVHRLDQGETIRRQPPHGSPADHWVFQNALAFEVAPRFALEIDRGVVVGDYGANVTPGGTLDFETSEYFGITDWREHPIFLRRRMPPVEHFDGTLVALATRGGSDNYFHFVLDVLPRYGIFEEAMRGRSADALYVANHTRYQRELLALAGLGDHHIIETQKHRAIRADHLVVPSLPNPQEIAPRWTVEWLRSRLTASDTSDKPKRIYVTRGDRRNTRRMVREEELIALLEPRGFVRIDAGALTVREQIDHFAAAEVIVAPHGAALTNLVFASAGVKVLEIFPASYVKACFWTITQSIPGAQYSYLVAGDADRFGPGSPMNQIQADIHVDPSVVIDAVDRLMAT